MINNANLSQAKIAKNDEFYTQFADIEREMNAYIEHNKDVFRNKTILLPCDDPEYSNFTKYFALNFERFGLKKLISTSYAKSALNQNCITDVERKSPLFDETKHYTCGKVFILTEDSNYSGRIDINDVQFSGYLKGDGDFQSDEVKCLRDEADIIITNPPFSLFRVFIPWIMESQKQFIVIGNKNAITYKEIFPLIKNNEIWLGTSCPKEFLLNNGSLTKRINGLCRWFTNIDHDLRHDDLTLMTMEHNLKYNKKLRKKFETNYGNLEYPKYDNYDAIEVPFVDTIPSDYDGVMGVPITFLDKYNPEDFEIIANFNANNEKDAKFYYAKSQYVSIVSEKTETNWNGPVVNKRPLYKRILIKHKKEVR